ncbi:MAG: protein-(glutamine-N5) methyltransferase, release factor-specific, partial [Clostridia bacterium]|nr:protein-(glutamine-N5) methyltransferase, release factor-specific [Clostridia bacterium]
MTLRELIRAGAEYLTENGVEDAAFDARQLAMFLFSLDGTALLLQGDRTVSPEEQAACRALLERR